MSYTYIEAISVGFPAVQCHAPGIGDVYEDIVWDGGAPLPSKEAIDSWIAANPKQQGIVLTKYEFRKLFTLQERITCDNISSATTVPEQDRAAIATFMKDLDASGAVFLTDNPDVSAGLNMLEQIGILAPGRAARILSNQPPV